MSKKTKLIFEEGRDYRFAKVLLRLGLLALGVATVIYSFNDAELAILKIPGFTSMAMSIFPYKSATQNSRGIEWSADKR
jgi:hypothetical protein